MRTKKRFLFNTFYFSSRRLPLYLSPSHPLPFTQIPYLCRHNQHLSSKKMKKVLRLAGGFIAGACLGVAIAKGAMMIFSDTPAGDFEGKAAAVDFGLIIGRILLGGVLTLLAIFLQIILHEGGHLVCGLASGYRFVSFRILNLTLIRQNGKFRLKRYGLAGTGGQCLLTPPERPLQDIPTTLYNLGGVLFNLLTAAAAILILLTVDGMPHFLHLFLLLFGLMGIVIGLTNGIPMKLSGISNDTANMRLLRRNPASKRAMMNQLRINAAVQEGTRPKDMPAEWFTPAGETDYKDALQTGIAVMAAGRLLDCEQWESAYDALEEAMSHKDEILGLYVKEISCELLYLSLLLGKEERADQLCTKELDTYINQYKNLMSSKQRLLCALALFREKDAAKARRIYEDVCRRRDQYLMQGEVAMDIALMDSMLTAANA